MQRLTIEYIDGYWPREMCSIGRDGYADDCDLCCEYCHATIEGYEDCTACAIHDCFNRLGAYENALETIEKKQEELRSCLEYPHNLTGEKAELLQWVLNLFKQEERGEST